MSVLITRLVVVIITVAVSAHALHLHNTYSGYVSYIDSQQGDVKAKLDQLDRKLSQHYQYVQKQNDIDKKIALLEDYINQERLLLVETHMLTFDQQLNTSAWVCPRWQSSKKTQTQASLDAIALDIKDINQVLSPLNDSQIGQGIGVGKEQLMRAEKTIQQLNSVIASTGTEIDPLSIIIDRKSNLGSIKWMLDGKKIDQLNNQYKRASQSGALLICPINQPFFSPKQNLCISCNGDKQFFSLRTGQCTLCYTFDIKQHKCKDNEGASTNILPSTENRIIISQGKSLSDYKQQSESGVPCPENAPFYTGSECIQCEAFFDIATETCATCQGKYHYDLKTRNCKMDEVTVSNLDAGKALIIIPNDKNMADIINDYKTLEQDKKLIVCPSEKPFFNDFQCISCSDGTLFSMVQKSCGTCETGTYFNKLTNHCQFKWYYSNLEDPNWASKRTYPEIQKELQEMQKDPLYEKCPVDTPFSTGKVCIECDKDEHFDMDKKKCDKCYNGQIFNKNLHKCSFTQNNLQTNPEKTQNLIFEGRPKNEWMYIYYQNIEKSEGMTDCPSQKPYFDGLSCIVCPEEHPYFNLQFKMCQKCPSGTQYNKTHHECLTTEGNIATQVPTFQKMAAGIFS